MAATGRAPIALTCTGTAAGAGRTRLFQFEPVPGRPFQKVGADTLMTPLMASWEPAIPVELTFTSSMEWAVSERPHKGGWIKELNALRQLRAHQRFAGEWVAISDADVVAHGSDLPAVVAAARSRGVAVPLVARMEPVERDLIPIGL